MPPKTLDRLIYVDDSGHSESGLVVYGWIEFAPHDWHSVLGQWLDSRKRLWRHFGVPVQQELHMTKYALGRGRISTKVPPAFIDDDGREQWKELGGAVARESLGVMSSIQGLRVGAVYRQATRETWAENRADVYGVLVDQLDSTLAATGSLAMVFMDGDGSDSSYRDVHRRLKRGLRSVIEDPIYTDSKTSQLMQMADHVAWCANASIARIPKHVFAHDWYEDHLSRRDPLRAPRAV